MSPENNDDIGKKQLIIINDFFRSRDILFFYSDRKELSRVLSAILDPLLKTGEHKAIYNYPREEDKLGRLEAFEKNENFHHFPILDRKYKKIFVDDVKDFKKRLAKVLTGLDEGSKVKILIDYEKTVTDENVDDIIRLKTDLDKKFRDKLENQIYSFDIRSLTKQVIEKIICLGEKFVIASDNDYIILSSFLPEDGGGEAPKIELLSRKDMEDRVKKSIDCIMYSILQNTSLCGFDIIKNIILHFNVFLSQGTIYPILYNLTEKGFLEVKVQPDNKTRVYSVTEEGKAYFTTKISSYVDAQERVTAFIRSQMEAYQNE